MYSNKLVACVKADGKVLREKGETILLPFGSEYTLWFKNEHSRKVQINVEIDGTDVLFDKALLLDAGETMDLKGFVRDNNGDDNRAFRFITKTQEISDFRGDRIEDGLIKITYQFEKEIKLEDQLNKIINENHYHNTYNYPPYNTHPWDNPYQPNKYPWDNIRCSSGDNISDNLNTQNSVFTSSVNDGDMLRSTSATFSTQSMNNVTRSVDTSYEVSEPGITVEGSETGQSFQNGFIGSLESRTHTMIFQLKGLSENEEVVKPVTVKTKKQCPSCGKKWKNTFEYCPHDGTFLRNP